MTAQRDLVGVVETAYRCGQSDSAWLEALVTEVQPLLDVGQGISAFFFDAENPEKFEFSRPIVLGAPVGAGLGLSAALELLPAPMVKQAFGARTWMTTASEAFGLGESLRDFWLARQFGHRFGCYDILGLKAHDPTGRGVILMVSLPEITRVSPREAEIWGMCTAHIAAALRLRRILSASSLDDAEAVLEPDGACVHASGAATPADARDILRRAVLESERARGSLRRKDPAEALETWRALIAGRWSVVEQFDTDGHRYIVARRNDPAVRDPRGLSLRERQVAACAALGHPSKLIGYELGLAPSTVSKHLASAMKKLGVRTHAELMQAVDGKVKVKARTREA